MECRTDFGFLRDFTALPPLRTFGVAFASTLPAVAVGLGGCCFMSPVIAGVWFGCCCTRLMGSVGTAAAAGAGASGASDAAGNPLKVESFSLESCSRGCFGGGVHKCGESMR